MTNRIFISILLASIAGGCFSTIFLATEKYIYRYTSAKYSIFLNILVLTTFIIPFFKIFSWLDSSSYLFTKYSHVIFAELDSTKWNVFNYIIDNSLASIIIAMWLFGFMLYLLINTCLYGFWFCSIRKNSIIINHYLWTSAFTEICAQENINKTILLVSNDKITTPCTTGITKKYIIIPSHVLNKLTFEEIKTILLHEITHIKRHDIRLKILIMLCNSLHWFNPLFYLMRNNLNDWTEMACDEEIILPMNIHQRKTYINVLIKLIEEGQKNIETYIICFGGNKTKKLKRRLDGIMNKKNRGRTACKTLVSLLAFITLATASVIAKAADGSINDIFAEKTELSSTDELTLITDKDLDLLIENEKSDEMDVLDLSTVELLSQDFQTRHQHQFTDTKLKEHKKANDGSCKITIYEAKLCTVCNKCLKGDVYSESTYKTCKH